MVRRYSLRTSSVLLALVALLASACGDKRPVQSATNPAAPRVALITPGSIADAAWNSGAFRGLQQIRDSLGLEVSHVEARTPAEQEAALRTYAEQGYRLVFAHGFEFQRPAERVGAAYAGTTFVVTSGGAPAPNVVPMIFRLHDATYLAGMASGALTRSNTIAFVGGVEIPPVRLAYEAWVHGARAVNPAVQPRAAYLNNWDDAAAGREQAIALLRAGADVFHHNADAAALGVFAAVKASPAALIFGANEDQASLAPERVPGSAVIDLPKAFLLIGRQLVAGSPLPAREEFGLKDGVVRYVPNPLFAVPPALVARLDAAADSIRAGTLDPLAAARP